MLTFDSWLKIRFKKWIGRRKKYENRTQQEDKKGMHHSDCAQYIALKNVTFPKDSLLRV